jgi:hypothetical protein
VDDDLQAANSADQPEPIAKLLKQLDIAFHAHDPQEAERPTAARQIRYMFAMRAIGDLLKSARRADLQHPFYKLAEALHDHAEGRPHPLLGIDATVKPGKGAPPDTHDLWRLRARLCAGILWLEEAGLTRHDEEDGAISEAMRGRRTQLSNLRRRETDSLEGSIKEWFRRLENPTQEDDPVAVVLFQAEKEEMEAQSKAMSVKQLRDKGLKIIDGVAGEASRLLKKKKK